MRTLSRILGVFVPASLVLLVVMASPAAALNETVLCKVNEVPCKTTNQYPINSSFKAVATKPKFNLSGGAPEYTVGCAEATLVNKITAVSGNPLPGEVNSMAFETCKEEPGGEACSVTMLQLPYKTEIERGTAPDGTMRLWRNEEGKDPRFRISCFGAKLKCTYGESPVTLSIHGANPAEFFTSTTGLQLLFEEGTLECPTGGTWTANFFATEPKPVFVSRN